MKSLLSGTLILLALLIHFYLPSSKPQPNTTLASQQAAGAATPESANRRTFPPIKTESKFSEKLIEDSEILKRKTVYQDDPATEAGIDTVLEDGEDGKKTQVTKIIYYEGKEYGKEIMDTEIIKPGDKIISRGTKIIWKTLTTPDGEIRYWKKMRVYATHYDKYCKGCDEWTAIGMRAGFGVVAVDPKVIKLRSKVYIPGYGLAVAGDTGGAIKGNIIDLGFEDAKTAGWSAKFTDIYILD